MALTHSLKRMATSSGSAIEGLFAINKPISISSAQALRKLQYIFQKSPLFKDWISAERSKRQRQPNHQKKRSKRRVRVKLGHGGTLDPLATGVLVVGIGSGTKKLSSCLGAEKEYVATAILGAVTDTYDRLGKVTKRVEWRHVTREMVEEKLDMFRGEIMQVPPIFSALNMNGKRLYEYARNGEELPKEIEPRKMKVNSLELLSFETEHEWALPAEEAEVEKLEKKVEEMGGVEESVVKRVKVGGDARGTGQAAPARAGRTGSPAVVASEKPPILKFHMKVSSGFYVRSFIHDLGIALGSAAHMVALVRTRQSAFELGKENTIEWEDFGVTLKKQDLIGEGVEKKEMGVEQVEEVEQEVEVQEVEVEEAEEAEEAEKGKEGEEKPRPVWEAKFTRAIELFRKSQGGEGVAGKIESW